MRPTDAETNFIKLLNHLTIASKNTIYTNQATFCSGKSQNILTTLLAKKLAYQAMGKP